jgi:hypothetical protein
VGEDEVDDTMKTPRGGNRVGKAPFVDLMREVREEEMLVRDGMRRIEALHADVRHWPDEPFYRRPGYYVVVGAGQTWSVVESSEQPPNQTIRQAAMWAAKHLPEAPETQLPNYSCFGPLSKNDVARLQAAIEESVLDYADVVDRYLFGSPEIRTRSAPRGLRIAQRRRGTTR